MLRFIDQEGPELPPPQLAQQPSAPPVEQEPIRQPLQDLSIQPSQTSPEPLADLRLGNQLATQVNEQDGYEDIAQLDLRGAFQKVGTATQAVFSHLDKLLNGKKPKPATSSAPAPKDSNARIAAAALAFENQSTVAGPDAGRNACAWAINKVLNNAGVKVPWVEAGQESVYIPYIENSIKKGAGKQVSMEEAKPGDIISFGGDHMAIVTKVSGGTVSWLSNSSSKASFSYGGSFSPPKPSKGNSRIAQIEAEIQAEQRQHTRIYRLNP